MRPWWVGVLVVTGWAAAAWSAAAAAPERYVIVPSESQVIYRVGEEFLEQGTPFNVAVGTTNAVHGEVLIDRADPRRSRVGPITVDVSQFQSDQPRRDNAIRRRWLESERYPTAVFTPTAIHGLPDAYTPGHEILAEITGTLRIRDVTRVTTFATRIRLDGDTLTGVATAMIHMTDFGFAPPSILGFVKTENEAALELHFLARRAG